jgi:hypothetical protein
VSRHRHPLLSLTLVAAQFISACASGALDPSITPPPPDGGVEPPPPPPVPGPLPPKNESAPTVEITSPSDGDDVEASIVVRGTAADDSGLASVFVQVGPNTPRLATTTDGFRTWSFESATPLGTFAVEAVAYDTDGRRTAMPARVLVSRAPSDAGAASPTVVIASPEDGITTRDVNVVVTGTASDDVAVVRMEVERNGEILEERRIDTEDFFATWARLVPLLSGQENVLVFRAFDELGNTGEATITLVGRAELDRDPPQLEVASPEGGDIVDTVAVEVTGSASDNLGVREVKVRAGQSFAGTGDVVFEEWVFATTDDGFATFSANLPIPSGDITLEVKAIDVSGLATSALIELSSTFVAEWGAEQRIPLFIREVPDTTVRLELDHEGTNEVIPENVQRNLDLLEVDPEALILSSLDQIKNACGTDWQLASEDPNHDCDLTSLGQTFEGSNGSWETSAEYSLVRLLTMTSANVVVDGTSIEGLKELAGALSILGLDFREILADTLGVASTDEIVGTDAVAEALQTNLLASHPNTGPNGELPITLYDAMNDLAPLATTLGPAGGHPGIIDPSSPPNGVVLGGDFLMTIVAESNLRWLDGIDLDGGKDYLAVVVDTVGPSYDDVLEFDFEDPARFEIDGIVDAPTVDLRIQVEETASFISACTTGEQTTANCQGNLPTTPFGSSYVWSRPAWELEHIIARAAFNQYELRDDIRNSYLVGACIVRVGDEDEPAGWTRFYTTFGLGNPPEDQYLWELISEVGQVALHRLPAGTLAEGAANVAFTLEDVDVGITAEEIREAVRPTLQDQASMLSDMLLGDYAANNGPVDFYYRRGADDVPTLFFVAPTDPRPTPGYSYENPGFFSDATLTTKVSTTHLPGSGDTDHEKVRLSTGETVLYAEDEAGSIYRLRFVVGADPTEIAVYVSRRAL